jgi:uncharacterized protein YegP (UPF0339 family)
VDLGGVFALTPMRPMVPELSREIEQMREEEGLSTEELLEGLRKQRRRYFKEHYAEEVARFAEEAFEVYEDDASRWRWQLHAGNRDVLAHSAETYAQKADADAALEAFMQSVPAAADDHSGRADDSMRGARFNVYREDEVNTYRWRLVTPNGTSVAESAQRYAEKRDAERDVLRVQRIVDIAGA